jgi:hypothetical protein
MKSRIGLLISGTAVVCMALASCGGDSGSAPPPAPPAPPAAPPAPPPPPPMTMDLDTGAVLVLVQTTTSETTEPFQVDGAAVAVTPVGDETSSPISVDST